MLKAMVVICFRISIFEPLKTTIAKNNNGTFELWFAFELVSLNHWKQPEAARAYAEASCDLLSN